MDIRKHYDSFVSKFMAGDGQADETGVEDQHPERSAAKYQGDSVTARLKSTLRRRPESAKLSRARRLRPSDPARPAQDLCRPPRTYSQKIQRTLKQIRRILGPRLAGVEIPNCVEK